MRDKDIKEIVLEVLSAILKHKEYEKKILEYGSEFPDYDKPKKLSLEEKIEAYIEEYYENIS